MANRKFRKNCFPLKAGQYTVHRIQYTVHSIQSPVSIIHCPSFTVQYLASWFLVAVYCVLLPGTWFLVAACWELETGGPHVAHPQPKDTFLFVILSFAPNLVFAGPRFGAKHRMTRKEWPHCPALSGWPSCPALSRYSPST